MRKILKITFILGSIYCILLGLFLLIYNFGIIKENTWTFALRLWPVSLMVVGSLFYFNPFKIKTHTEITPIVSKEFSLKETDNLSELALKIDFAYGNLKIDSTQNSPFLITEQADSLVQPKIEFTKTGSIPSLSISMNKPFLHSSVTSTNSWQLYCNKKTQHQLDINIDKCNLLVDIRKIIVENLNITADSGIHEIMIGDKQKRFKGKIYSSSNKLSLIIPSRTFTRIFLLNHFCKMDYPQGDFNKMEDGSFIYEKNCENSKSIDIIIDGPLKSLFLDIEEI